MHVAHDQAGLAGHCRVDGVPCDEVAEDRVLGVGGAASNLVARIEIMQRHPDALRLEMRLDLLTQKDADVLEFDVAGRVSRCSRLGSRKFLTGALGHDDNGVRAFADAALECGEESTLAVQAEGHLGDERQVHVVAGDRCTGGDKPRVASHELHERDAVQSDFDDCALWKLSPS